MVGSPNGNDPNLESCWRISSFTVFKVVCIREFMSVPAATSPKSVPANKSDLDVAYWNKDREKN